MNGPEPNVRLHEDRELFQRAVRLTAERTGFVSRLIEKDYFCTLLLEYLAAADPALVFKGGTCLAIVHAGFFRLSEDLDFSLPMASDASRGQRRKGAERVKRALATLTAQVGAFRLVEPWQGANNSTHYTAVVGYAGISGQLEIIQIEVGLREPLLMPAVAATARTLLLDPVTGGELVPPVKLNCLAKMEAFAEKFRVVS